MKPFKLKQDWHNSHIEAMMVDICCPTCGKNAIATASSAFVVPAPCKVGPDGTIMIHKARVIIYCAQNNWGSIIQEINEYFSGD